MNYETPGPDTAIGKLAASVKALTEQIPRIKKRLADEKTNSEGLRRRIQELESRAGEILIDDKNAYEKYRTSLKKLNNELETSTSMIQSLSDSLPSKQTEYSERTRNLRILLDAYYIQSRPTSDARIIEFLKSYVIPEIQAFIDRFTKIYAACGLDFIVSSDDFYPGPWSGQQVRDMCLSLGFGISRTGTIQAPTKPQDAPEPVQIPTEDVSQAVESQAPQPKPGITLLT